MRSNITKSIGDRVAEIIAQRRNHAIGNIGVAAQILYRTGARNPDGSVSWFRNGEWDHNLILNSGLDSIGARTWAETFTYGAAGTGTNPVERDSGSTTFTVAAGVVTASANFFEAADTNRLLRLDSGEQGYLTYSSATSATWNGVATAGPSEGTIYYVNRTALQTEVKRTNTYRTSSGDNSTVWNGTAKTFTHQRTFLFSAEVGPVTYREVGWSWGSGATSLFGIDILSGGGDSLVAGQQYLVQVQLVLRVSPNVSTSAPDVGSGGWNTEGDCILADVRAGADGGGAFPWSQVSSSGSAGGGSSMEPGASGNIPLHRISTSQALPAGQSEAQVAAPTSGGDMGDMTRATYVAASFTRTASITASVSQGNGSWYGIVVARADSGGAPYSVAFALVFDNFQTKDNVHTLTVTIRWTWNRYFA